MRNLAFLGFGYLLLIVQSAIAAHIALHPLTPNLLLPIVIFLGVQPEVGLLRGALISFVLGYLLDEFCGSPMGLQTFVLVATFMVARGAGIRLFLRGALFQVGLVFTASILAGGTILALRAIFSQPDPFPLQMPAGGVAGDIVMFVTGTSLEDAPLIGSVVGMTFMLIGSALITALFAPAIFSVTRRIDALRTRRRDTEGAPSE
jgi:rod shape-determining protein MreD